MAKLPFTDDELEGMSACSELFRTELSGANSLVGPNQRAELARLMAEAFEIEERIARLYFTKAKARRQMLRIDLEPDDLRARIILAKAVVNGQNNHNERSNYERISPFGVTEVTSSKLRDCLYGPYVGEIFHWDFNGYRFNLLNGSTPQDKTSFWLQWDYEAGIVPEWVPKYLRPFDGIDPDPY